MAVLESDEKQVKEGKLLKTLTSNKLLTRFSVLLVQIKAANDSWNLKIEIRQILYIVYKHNKSTKSVYNKLIIAL